VEEKNPVIIAGFGRMGSIVGRFLRANNLQATFLDIDADNVDLLRNLGLKVFYGDASRVDLLRAGRPGERRSRRSPRAFPEQAPTRASASSRSRSGRGRHRARVMVGAGRRGALPSYSRAWCWLRSRH
jgi:voltage-gated potassium channel Kch